jgi:hypothetical protein
MLQMMKNVNDFLKGWRTIIWGIVQTIPGFWLMFSDDFAGSGLDITPLLTELHLQDKKGALLVAYGIITIFFRTLTKGPVGDKSAHAIEEVKTT